jgi:hypothetical protein
MVDLGVKKHGSISLLHVYEWPVLRSGHFIPGEILRSSRRDVDSSNDSPVPVFPCSIVFVWLRFTTDLRDCFLNLTTLEISFYLKPATGHLLR